MNVPIRLVYAEACVPKSESVLTQAFSVVTVHFSRGSESGDSGSGSGEEAVAGSRKEQPCELMELATRSRSQTWPL